MRAIARQTGAVAGQRPKCHLADRSTGQFRNPAVQAILQRDLAALNPVREQHPRHGLPVGSSLERAVFIRADAGIPSGTPPLHKHRGELVVAVRPTESIQDGLVTGTSLREPRPDDQVGSSRQEREDHHARQDDHPPTPPRRRGHTLHATLAITGWVIIFQPNGASRAVQPAEGSSASRAWSGPAATTWRRCTATPPRGGHPGAPDPQSRGPWSPAITWPRRNPAPPAALLERSDEPLRQPTGARSRTLLVSKVMSRAVRITSMPSCVFGRGGHHRHVASVAADPMDAAVSRAGESHPGQGRLPRQRPPLVRPWHGQSQSAAGSVAPRLTQRCLSSVECDRLDR